MNMLDKNKFYYMLAPIENVTDSCFRSICRGADMTFTEMTSLEALAKGDPFAWERIKFYDNTPCTIQIIGHKEDSLREFLSKFKPERGFCGFNLNLGCPDPEAVRAGNGCAMMKRISKVTRFIQFIKSFGYSVSIKMRLGMNQFEKERKVYLNLIENVDADYFIVHARHGKEAYADKADWSVFPECVKTGKNIIANGDIRTKEDAEKLKYCRGVMIGRQAVLDPLIFSKLKGLEVPELESVKSEYEKLAEERNAHTKYKSHFLKHSRLNEISEKR